MNPSIQAEINRISAELTKAHYAGKTKRQEKYARLLDQLTAKVRREEGTRRE